MQEIMIRFTCDNPECGNSQIKERSSQPCGYRIYEGAYVDASCNTPVFIPDTFVCSLDCMVEAIDAVVSAEIRAMQAR